MEVLRETLGDIIEPVKKVFKKKPKMLEEQIRDEVPQDSKSEEEKNEEV
tara:strand:+ start:1137 stop:1283 length:147 start_codon:yes stop_codon:yes gene_type:complete